jgi:hypothetical protein
VRKVEENTSFGKYANAARAERGAGGLRGGVGRRPTGQSRPARGRAGPDGPKSEENSFLNKN